MSRRRKRRTPRDMLFVQLHNWMIDSEAFRKLRGDPCKLLVLLCRRFNGTNNGSIYMSVRQAKVELNCSLNHAAACYKVLEREGFIRAVERGAFSRKDRHATTWRLTWLPYRDDPPTKDFMRPDRGRKEVVNGVVVDVSEAAEKKKRSHEDDCRSH